MDMHNGILIMVVVLAVTIIAIEHIWVVVVVNLTACCPKSQNME